MVKKILFSLISIIILNNFNILNASSIKEELKKELEDIDNIQQNKKYWEEFLPTIKCSAKETLKDRFEYCSDWVIKLLQSKTLFYKINSINNYEYIIDSIDDAIDVQSFINEVQNRKKVLDNINCKDILNGNPWSEIPLKITGYNDLHRNLIGKYLNFHCLLLPNHWFMKFDKDYNNVTLNFYASYEYQEPRFYSNTLNSEQTLSICLSAIEMDLLTSNNLTSNIELFANYLIMRKDNVAKAEVIRYNKYFNDKQNEMLANHIVSYHLSFPGVKKKNIAKYLATYYVLKDLFTKIKFNNFLNTVNKYRTEDWFNIIINKYLDNLFQTNYNKSYLKYFKNVILTDKNELKKTIFPIFKRYTMLVFRSLAEINNNIITLNENYLKKRDTSRLIFPTTDKEYNSGIKILGALVGANPGYQSGSKTIDNIMSYINYTKPI